MRGTNDNSVVNCEYGKLVQSCDKIPSSGDVSGDKDYDSEDRERVHQSASEAKTCYSVNIDEGGDVQVQSLTR